MVAIRSASRKRWLSQLGLSICATVTATLLVTGVQHHVAWFRAEPARVAADLTSGGKFAARVEALRAVSDTPAIAPVPLLAADAGFQALPASFTPPASTPLADIGKPVRRPTHPDAHRRTAVEVAREVVPPKRSEHVAEPAVAPRLTLSVEGGETGLWASSKEAYRDAVALGSAALDRINPLNLIP